MKRGTDEEKTNEKGYFKTPKFILEQSNMVRECRIHLTDKDMRQCGEVPAQAQPVQLSQCCVPAPPPGLQVTEGLWSQEAPWDTGLSKFRKPMPGSTKVWLCVSEIADTRPSLGLLHLELRTVTLLLLK